MPPERERESAAAAPEPDDEGVTTEFAKVAQWSGGTEDASRLPARTDPRDGLPGVEPERDLTDWGRSRRVDGAFDRLVFDFLFHYWFRVEVEGIENVPAEGGALLVANRSGGLPADAAMIAKAIAELHPSARPLQVSIRDGLTTVPGLGMVITKLGGVPAHPANLHRLLLDEEQLVLAFPEAPASGKALGRRYLLRPFSGTFAGTAGRAGVPIVPVALLGAEEASPVLSRLGGSSRRSLWRRIPPLRRLARLPLASPLPLPAKFRIRFLEPVEVDTAALDGAARTVLAGDVRALIQENLLEMVSERRSVWLG